MLVATTTATRPPEDEWDKPSEIPQLTLNRVGATSQILQSLSDMETRLNDGLIAAHNLSSIPDINFPSRRAIICLTDGINEYSAGGATKQEVIEVLNGQRLSVYTIGFAENLNKREQEVLKERERERERE